MLSRVKEDKFIQLLRNDEGNEKVMKKFFGRSGREIPRGKDISNWEEYDIEGMDWEDAEHWEEASPESEEQPEEIEYTEDAEDAEYWEEAFPESEEQLEEIEYAENAEDAEDANYWEEAFPASEEQLEEIEYTENAEDAEDANYWEEASPASEEQPEEIEYTEDTEDANYWEDASPASEEQLEETEYAEDAEDTEDANYWEDASPASEEQPEETEYAEDAEDAEDANYWEDASPASDEQTEEAWYADYSDAGNKNNVKTPPAGRTAQGKKKKSFHMDLMDKLILGMGVAVLLLAAVIGGLYISSRLRTDSVTVMASVGNQLENIHIIGEKGLTAVANARISKLALQETVDESNQEPEDDEDETDDPGYNEEEYRRDVQVVMEFVSIQKDLKIKFVNEKTKKLIANVPFVVSVSGPDGGSLTWSDDDMDGIIYKKDIAPGNYSVKLKELTDKKYASYTLSSMARTVDVKKEIAYKKVEVANEIKSEDEVDAKAEDTMKNDTVVESTLQDTVGWVESTVKDGVYSEVPKSAIPNPETVINKKYFANASAVSSGDIDKPLTKGKITLQPAALSVVTGGTVYAQADVSDFSAGKELVYSVTGGNGAVNAGIDSTGKVTVTGLKDGTVPLTVTVNYKDGGTAETAATAVLNVTVTPPKTLSLDRTTAVVYIGEPLVLNAVVPETVAPDIRVSSQDESVATVSVNQTKITVDGKKAGGTTKITVNLVENNIVTATVECIVAVAENPKNDTVSKLTDVDNNQLYILENGEYREAVYADYFVESNVFYVKTEELYTGWQTIDGKVYYYTNDGKYVTGEQVIQGAKYNFASDGSLVTGQGTGIMGIDVSKWNGKIDWNAVKNSGVNYAIIRCGYRGSSAGSLIEDPKYVDNIKGATAAGINVGVYFFTQAIDEREAVEEASMVLELVKNYRISYPIFLDVESSGGRADSIDVQTRTAVCRAFCQTIQNAGYTAGIYANKNWLENKIDAGALSAYKIWLAQYAAAPTYTGRYDMWQYRSTGTVGGISGNVDMNLSYLGY